MTIERDDKAIAISINKKEFSVGESDLTPDDEITFERITAIGVQGGILPSGEFIEYRIGYENGAGRPPDGELQPGQKLKIQNGTRFNVTAIDTS